MSTDCSGLVVILCFWDSFEIGSLAKGTRMCGYLGQVSDRQKSSMRTEWVTTHSKYHAGFSQLYPG